MGAADWDPTGTTKKVMAALNLFSTIMNYCWDMIERSLSRQQFALGEAQTHATDLATAAETRANDNTQNALDLATRAEHFDMRLLWSVVRLGEAIQAMAANFKTRYETRRFFQSVLTVTVKEEENHKMRAVGESADRDDELMEVLVTIK